MPSNLGSAAAAVGAGDDLEEVPTRILEVDTAPAIVGVDLALFMLVGVGPVGQIASSDATEDLVEVALVDEERVVLRRDVIAPVHEVEADVVIRGHNEERTKRGGLREAENLREKRRGYLLVAGTHDRV